MKSRRDFAKLVSATSLFTLLGCRQRQAPIALPMPSKLSTGAEDRTYWCQVASRLASPMLMALAKRELKNTMPVEVHQRSKERSQYTHLEGLGRLLAGLAPWLQLGEDTSAEGRERGRFAALAREGIDSATDPTSPDFLNFSEGRQPRVDTAFLAQGILRAQTELWKKLEPRVKKNVIAAMVSSRPIRGIENNWTLFATIIEAFLHRVGAKRDDAGLFEGIKKHREWYIGDGMYGDGPEFHWDYYNSYVVQPMLVESLDVVANEALEWSSFRDEAIERLTRYAAIQERMIAPDGSFPPIGRSIAYRAGAFQGLALAALRKILPIEVSPSQARVALTSVIRRTMEALGTFDANGWLQIGLAGHQPALGETYISTGSLYLCSIALLPLGLSASDPFWTGSAEKTTWEKAWSGEDLLADEAFKSPT